MTAQTLESRYRVTGMDCASCGRKIDTAIRRLPGVEDVSVAVQTGVLKIRHDGDLADEAVLQQLRNLGYSGEAASPTSGSVAAPAGPPPAAAGPGAPRGGGPGRRASPRSAAWRCCPPMDWARCSPPSNDTPSSPPWPWG